LYNIILLASFPKAPNFWHAKSDLQKFSFHAKSDPRKSYHHIIRQIPGFLFSFIFDSEHVCALLCVVAV
uniref:Uncharacterized protein n=1 Tax=Romanomermis culicivorax TaxID=13658 RepID=A0A915I802_ROMCU